MARTKSGLTVTMHGVSRIGALEALPACGPRQAHRRTARVSASGADPVVHAGLLVALSLRSLLRQLGFHAVPHPAFVLGRNGRRRGLVRLLPRVSFEPIFVAGFTAKQFLEPSHMQYPSFADQSRKFAVPTINLSAARADRPDAAFPQTKPRAGTCLAGVSWNRHAPGNVG